MKLLLIVIFVLSFSFVGFGQNYQRSFYVENRLIKEIRVTNKILEALRNDVQIENCLKYSKENYLKPDWFKATKIKLNNDKLADVIVEPTRVGNCRTAMRPPYWLLINKGNNYKLVLTVNTFSLYINKEKTNKHFNITIDWSTANTHYKTTYGFIGKKYKVIAHKEEPNT